MDVNKVMAVVSAALEIIDGVGKIQERVSRVHGIIHEKAPAEMNGLKGFLVWDYIIWNDITFDDENGNIWSFFNSISDDKTKAMWDQLVDKFGV